MWQDARLLLFAIHYSSSRRLTEVGIGLAILGALALLGAVVPRARSTAIPLSGLLMAIGLVLVLIAVRWGVNPYVRHK